MNRVTSYTVGLLLALILTLSAFSLTFLRLQGVAGLLPNSWFLPVILTLAMAQLVVQLWFFLHLGQGKDSRWNASMFAFTFFAVLVVIVASVWIMYHLNYNMTPMQMSQYVTDQSSF